MYTKDSLYRFLQKKGRWAFEELLKNNPDLEKWKDEVLAMANYSA